MALLHTLVDTFQPPSLSAYWGAPTGSVVVDGQLNLNATPAQDAFIGSVAQWTLTSSSGFVKIIDPGAYTAGAFKSPLFLSSVSTDISWQLAGAFIYAYFDTTQLYSGTYSSTTHKYVRIRESGGTLYFDSSTDAVTWTVRASVGGIGVLPDFTVLIQNLNPTGINSSLIVDNFNSTSTTYTRSTSGTILYSGTVPRPQVIHFATAGGSINFSGNAIGRKQIDFAGIESKSLLYKAYDPSGVFMGLLNDVIPNFQLPEEINTAGSAVQLELARNSDTLIVSTETLQDHLSASILDSNSQTISTLSTSPNQIGDGSLVDYNNRIDAYVFTATRTLF